MRYDVGDLQTFYRSGLGQVAEERIARSVSALWPDAFDLDVLGLGYASPYLLPYRGHARRCIAAYPAAQGAERWPHAAPHKSVLVDDANMPFPDATFDRVLLVHALEEAESLPALLREIWRVCAPEGRVIAVVACRQGMWARADQTPFGFGRPFTRGQMATVFEDALFEPVASTRALYMPPFAWARGAHEAWERAGRTFWPKFSGVIAVEAIKRLYAPTGQARTERLGALKPVLIRPLTRNSSKKTLKTLEKT